MTFPTEAEAREFIRSTTIDIKIEKVSVIPTTHGYWTITSAKESERPAKTCSICGESFREFKNNAQPINGGGCCNYCDDHVVTPARLALSRQQRANS
jgi:hypothetical protein